MSKIQKQAANREKGESRTSTYLADEFWVLKRPVDIDGADFLIQLPATTLEELRQRSQYIEVLGIVQSKFFERNNAVKVAKSYVLDAEGVPRKEFFCFFHTDSPTGEHDTYFFTAEDIVRELEVTPCGDYYRFQLTKSRIYKGQKNLNRKDISQVMRSGVQRTEIASNKRFVRELFRIYATPTLHDEVKPDFVYSLRIVEGVRVVLCKSAGSPYGHLLEMRRDLYKNQGEYFWGGNGTGAMFLAVSMLAHHSKDDITEVAAANDLVINLLARLDMDCSHEVTSRDIFAALQKVNGREQRVDGLETAWFAKEYDQRIELVEVIERIGDVLKVKCKKGQEFCVTLSPAGMKKVEFIDLSLDIIARSTDAVVPVLFNFAEVTRDADSTVSAISLTEKYRFHNE